MFISFLVKIWFVNNTKLTRVFYKRQLLLWTISWDTNWVLSFPWVLLWLYIVLDFSLGMWGRPGACPVLLYFCRQFVLSHVGGGGEVMVTCHVLCVFTPSSGSVTWIETSVPVSSWLSTSARRPLGVRGGSASWAHTVCYCAFCVQESWLWVYLIIRHHDGSFH